MDLSIGSWFREEVKTIDEGVVKEVESACQMETDATKEPLVAAERC
jgi:hypothetical protein